MLKKYTTSSYKQTQKLGEKFAIQLRSGQAKEVRKSAVVLGLEGNRGGGKTTFLQGFAKGLGVKGKILSPTFVVMKRFALQGAGKNFYHIDCYRLKDEKDALKLDLKNIMADPKNIVAIEWPEKIKKVLSKSTIFVEFKFIDNKTREIKFKE